MNIDFVDKLVNATREDIDRFQKNFECVRKAHGLSSDGMAALLGLTRQTIRNLEIGRTTMSKTEFIAIQTVLYFY